MQASDKQEEKPAHRMGASETFATNMKRQREARGWSQVELSKELERFGINLRQQVLQKIESGQRPVRLDEGLAIAEALGIDVQRMVQGAMRSGPPDLKALSISAMNTLERVQAEVTAAVGVYNELESASRYVQGMGQQLQQELAGELATARTALLQSPIWGAVTALLDEVIEIYGLVGPGPYEHKIEGSYSFMHAKAECVLDYLTDNRDMMTSWWAGDLMMSRAFSDVLAWREAESDAAAP